MPTFIILGRFTQEGIKKIKESPQRLAEAQKVIKANEGEMKAFYYTLGQYDFVAIVEGPSVENAMRALFTICSAGAVRTETLVAIPAEKAAEILETLP